MAPAQMHWNIQSIRRIWVGSKVHAAKLEPSLFTLAEIPTVIKAQIMLVYE